MSTQFLTREAIGLVTPSALSTSHDGLRSNRYQFVPTVDIIDSMESQGWGVAAIRAPKARMARSREFGLHQLEFQDRNALAIQDPRSPNSRPIFPRIHIINSHNGASRFEVLAGLYAMVCSNGLMISAGSVGEFSVRHNTSFNAEEAHRIISEFRTKMSNFGETLDRWHRVTLSEDARRTFAVEAARIRWNKPDDIMPEPIQLLAVRRPEDCASDLWSTFNVVQENLIGGGFKRSRRVSRPVTHIRESNRINSELWDLADKYAQLA